MPVILYLIFTLLFLLLAAVAINGFFNVIQGKEETKPDGTIVRTGQLLRTWYFFWMEKDPRRDQRWYYTDDRLSLFVDSIRSIVGMSVEVSLPQEAGTETIQFFLASPEIKLYRARIERDKNVRMMIDEPQEINGTMMCKVAVYQLEEGYTMPKWVRKIMAQCVMCFSSVWGSLIFWCMFAFLGPDGRCQIYGWVAPGEYELFIFCNWVVFIISLVWVNIYLHKKA
jgi:hypothetical protein